MFMDLVLPWGCLDNWVVVLDTDLRRGAATSLGFQTQGSRMAGLESDVHRLTCFLIHYPLTH